jgi:hypothetical protein
VDGRLGLGVGVAEVRTPTAIDGDRRDHHG